VAINIFTQGILAGLPKESLAVGGALPYKRGSRVAGLHSYGAAFRVKAAGLMPRTCAEIEAEYAEVARKAIVSEAMRFAIREFEEKVKEGVNRQDVTNVERVQVIEARALSFLLATAQSSHNLWCNTPPLGVVWQARARVPTSVKLDIPPSQPSASLSGSTSKKRKD